MEILNGLQNRVINLDDKEFEQVALEVFQIQAVNNQVYQEYIGYLGVDPGKITKTEQIPFLPIELFKSRKIVTGSWNPEVVFTSSGTGSGLASKHYVQDTSYYEKISLKIFENFYPASTVYFSLNLSRCAFSIRQT